jgi:hypothetical protein
MVRGLLTTGGHPYVTGRIEKFLARQKLSAIVTAVLVDHDNA